MKQGETMPKDTAQRAEEYLREEMRKIDLLNSQCFSVKRVFEKSMLVTAFIWLKTGCVNSICDALKAVDMFRMKADVYKAQAEIEKKRGDSSGWGREHAEREQLYKWMADGLMDAVRKEESV